MFIRAKSFFKMLNALLASTRGDSFSTVFKKKRWQCLIPLLSKAHLNVPPNTWRSCLAHITELLPILPHRTSSQTIDQTPWYSLSAIRWHSLQEFKISISSVTILIAKLHIDMQRFIKEDLYNFKCALHSSATKSDRLWLFHYYEVHIIPEYLVFSKKNGTAMPDFLDWFWFIW